MRSVVTVSVMWCRSRRVAISRSAGAGSSWRGMNPRPGGGCWQEARGAVRSSAVHRAVVVRIARNVMGL